VTKKNNTKKKIHPPPPPPPPQKKTTQTSQPLTSATLSLSQDPAVAPPFQRKNKDQFNDIKRKDSKKTPN